MDATCAKCGKPVGQVAALAGAGGSDLVCVRCVSDPGPDPGAYPGAVLAAYLGDKRED